MPTITLPLVLGLAGFFLAALTVLPGVALKVVALVRRRPQPAVLGPLFWDELVRVTRRGSQLRLRTAYSLFLLAGLLVAYLGEFREINPVRLLFGGEEVPRERITAFAEAFFHVFLFCQLAALTAVTPVFAGGAVTEEKDRGTLAFLQTSLLSNREIVLGKLAARVVFVLGLSLTGLPVLALTLLFGGVDPDVLLTSFVAAVMSTVSLAALCFWLATRVETLKEVLVNAYVRVPIWFAVGLCLGQATPLFVCLSPFAFTLTVVGRWKALGLMDLTAAFVLVHGLLAIGYAVLAMGRVRPPIVENPHEDPPEEPYSPRVPTLTEATRPRPRYVSVTADGVRRERPPPRLRRIPYLDDDDPLAWKETHFGGSALRFEADLMGCVTGLLVATLIPLAFGVFLMLVSAERPGQALNWLFRITSVGMGVILLPLAGVRATGCVSRERQRQTLDSLFTLPVDRTELLRAKGWAALRWLKPWLIGFAAFTTVTTAFLSVPLVGLLLNLILLAAATAFFVALGVWLSVRCGTVVRAATWFLGLTFAAFVLPPMLAVLVRGAVQLAGGPGRVFDAATTSLSLPFALDAAAARGASDAWAGAAGAATLLALVLAAGAAALWRAAERRFEAEGR